MSPQRPFLPIALDLRLFRPMNSKPLPGTPKAQARPAKGRVHRDCRAGVKMVLQGVNRSLYKASERVCRAPSVGRLRGSLQRLVAQAGPRSCDAPLCATGIQYGHAKLRTSAGGASWLVVSGWTGGRRGIGRNGQCSGRERDEGEGTAVSLARAAGRGNEGWAWRGGAEAADLGVDVDVDAGTGADPGQRRKETRNKKSETRPAARISSRQGGQHEPPRRAVPAYRTRIPRHGGCLCGEDLTGMLSRKRLQGFLFTYATAR
ncbi:unnamed protein product [Diplocarpon coronariae]|uniref:Uncharacterized protein n=1 Tax=Diplocarpon coronariae TaxID=2795749 RepID=A0A218Z0R8_9HELO|nr:hypothetical protein B2J93_7050 [Marssonina coronariae]